MKTFIIEYEIFPMRAIHTVEHEADTEQEARDAFESAPKDCPGYNLRKVYEKGESVTMCGENHGYICDVFGHTGKAGMRPKAPVGDQGQRYMVVADFDGKEKPVGYTSNPTGGSLMEGAKKWPACTNPRVIDRKSPTKPNDN